MTIFSLNPLLIFVERTVMAPDIPKVNPDRILALELLRGISAIEVMRRLFHGQ
jgi:hypothetical protein